MVIEGAGPGSRSRAPVIRVVTMEKIWAEVAGTAWQRVMAAADRYHEPALQASAFTVSGAGRGSA